MSDPHVELASLQAKAWDRMNQRGHQLHAGPWVVLQTMGAALHQWHVLCHKSCRRCQQSVSIERRVLAGSMQFRMITPSHPCELRE